MEVFREGNAETMLERAVSTECWGQNTEHIAGGDEVDAELIIYFESLF